MVGRGIDHAGGGLPGSIRGPDPPMGGGMTIKAADIFALGRSLFEKAADLLLPIELTTPERKALSGLLFREGPFVVDLVADALRAQPHLFAGYGEDGEALAQEQARARAYRVLWVGLNSLAGLVSDNYLLAQGSALERAQRVLERAREAPESDPQKLERDMALLSANLLLEDRQRRLLRRHGRRQAEKDSKKPPRTRARALVEHLRDLFR
jgi:hypothetical protein